jgi:hypothetical protein
MNETTQQEGDFKFYYLKKSNMTIVDVEKSCTLVKLIGNEPCTMKVDRTGITEIRARSMRLIRLNSKPDGILFMVEPDLKIKDMR